MATPTSLYLKNAAVMLLVVTPFVLILLATTILDEEKKDEGKKKEHDQPPIIVLKESEDYTFNTGSAEILDKLAMALDKEIAPRLGRLARQYGCDVVEVIGHTDGQVLGLTSNLDVALSKVIVSESSSLKPGSNADLGLMRAWAVIAKLSKHRELANLKFYGYSAAQAIENDGTYAKPGDYADRPDRRRIEIRIRRSPPKPTASS